MRSGCRFLVAASFFLVLAGCGAGSSGGDWYYHWDCNGDSECLATNPSGTASGTLDEGPVEVNCTELLQFGDQFWGSAATQSCDQNSGSGGGTTSAPTISGVSPTGTAPGNVITITGSNFPPSISGVTVSIDSLDCTVTSVTSTQIVCTLPMMGDFTGPITVATSGGSVNSGSFSVVNHLYGVGTSGSQFVAVGGNGTLLTSPDGVTWTQRASNTTKTLTAVAWSSAQSAFVAVGLSGTILRSTDGVTWTASGVAGNSEDYYGVDWTGSEFVVVGAGTAIFTSTDGTHWSQRSSPTGLFMSNVAASGSVFVAAGQSGDIIKSPDSITWSLVSTTAPSSENLLGVIWSGSQFVAVGNGQTIVTSPDGTTWTRQTESEGGDLFGVVWSGSQFVVVGYDSSVDTTVLLTSPDGVNWTSRGITATDRSLNAVTWGNSEFVAVGGFGTIVTSLNGTTWTRRTGV